MTMSLPFYKDNTCQVIEIGLLKQDSQPSDILLPFNLNQQLLSSYHKINRFSEEFYENTKERIQEVAKILSCPEQIYNNLQTSPTLKPCLSKFCNSNKIQTESSNSSLFQDQQTVDHQENLQNQKTPSTKINNNTNLTLNNKNYSQTMSSDNSSELEVENQSNMFNIFSFQTPQKENKQLEDENTEKNIQINDDYTNLLSAKIEQEKVQQEENLEIQTYEEPSIRSRMESKRKFFDMFNKVQQQLDKVSEN